MNKQELIKKYEMKGEQLKEFPVVAIGDVLKNLRELDGPEKVTIPQLIAEKIEYCKETDGYSLFHAMDYCYNFKECADWLESNEEVFARAWLDGYEVEKEKRYLVKLKRVSSDYAFLTLNLCGDWFFYGKNDSDIYHTHHTQTELEEAGFGWVFDCEGVEVEEVDD